MKRYKDTGFADRLNTAAEAKKAQLERAVQARSAAESPAAVEKRREREAVRVARDARIAERKAARLANEAREAAALAAAQAAEAAAREAALKAEQEARDAEFAERTAREAASKPNGRLLAMPVMLLAKLGSEKADRPVSHRWIEEDLTYRVENTL